MEIWVLIIMLWWSSGNSITTHEFTTRANCEQAASIVKQGWGNTSVVFCTPK